MSFVDFIYRVASFLPSSIIYGRSFRNAKNLSISYQKAIDKKKFIADYEEKSIRKIIQLGEKTPFYAGINSNSFEGVNFIDKDLISNAAGNAIYTKAFSDLMTTGGTSGKPLSFYINKNRKGVEWFWMTQAWSLVGFNLKTSWRAVLRNHQLGDKDYTTNPLLKEICFDNFRLDYDYLCMITAEINKRNIEFIHAYPSAAFTLATHWKEHKSKPECVKTFLCGSENIYPYQKHLIQTELNLRMFSWFGHSEKLILAHENKECENYHANPFYGKAELVDVSGRNISVPGEIGELIGTGYINTKTIFIRYRTGDYAEFVGDACPCCGHIGLTFKNIKGRWGGDKIYLANSKFVTTTALNLHDDLYTKINGLQYHQSKKGELEIWVIPNIHWTNEDEIRLLSELSNKIKKDLIFTLKRVSELQYSKNMKYQLLIQKVNL
ncbi:MAG: phenylacetate-CoA ligase [Oleispira sp.]|jgi:phenylacetate-CoA ligase